jgi:hypothetical protein
VTVSDFLPRLVRRLKEMKLVPEDQAIRILIHRRRDSAVKWSAVNAVTGEDYHVGGADNVMRMYNRDWELTLKDDWVILEPGDLLPPARPGEEYRKGLRLGK